MKKLIAGNWKMSGGVDDARALIADIVNRLDGQDDVLEKCEFLVCPSFLHISAVRHAVHGFPKVRFGAQDCAATDEGAHTGEVSAKMLKDSACSYVIVGHSERRQDQGETSALVADKAKQALACDLVPIICVGETDADRQAGKAEDIVGAQLQGSIPALGAFDEIVIAYEPVWAIGTGNTATTADVEAMHSFIRGKLADHVKSPEKVRILYGGSMKPDNAAALLATPNVDGGLIGGASLKADDYIAIARAV